MTPRTASDSERSTAPSRFLDLRALATVAHMRFATRQRVEGPYSGRHPSRQQGGAGEFVDFREYSEGEDLRRLDWKVLARTGRAYIRLFQDETNLRCTLVVDASGSMRFGSSSGGSGPGSKLAYIQYLATALSHIIALQQDQVGLAVLTDGLQAHLPPGSKPDHVRRVQQDIADLQTRPATHLGAGLGELFRALSRRGVLLIMSDFLDEDLEGVFSGVRLYRHRYWEVIGLHIVHPQEERLPEGLAYRFEGLENEGHVDCTPAEIRTGYQQRFDKHAAMVRQLALSTGCDYRRISTATPYLQTLRSFLVERTG